MEWIILSKKCEAESGRETVGNRANGLTGKNADDLQKMTYEQQVVNNKDRGTLGKLMKGGIYPGAIPPAPVVGFTPGGLMLLVPLKFPDEYEQKALSAGGNARCGVFRSGRTGFLFIDFGEGFDMDFPFDAGIEKMENLFDPGPISDQSRLAVLIVGIDISTGKIFSLRYSTFSPRVTQQFLGAYFTQIAEPLPRSEMLKNVAAVYTRYPNPRHFKSRLTAFDKLGG